MNNNKHLFAKRWGLVCCGIATALTASIGFTACSEDDLGPSIYDTTEYPLDRSAYTFPLDTFVKKNFLEPYNLKYIYKMEDVGSDMQKNLVPATYEKSIDLAVLVKYLWLDVYAKLAGEKEVFLLNDYRSDQADSRRFGSIRFSGIDGRVIFLFRWRGL